MSLFVGYVGAKACTSKAQPGVVAFERAALAAIPASHSDGIYNCRDVRGSTTTTSLHGEGRAFDWGCSLGAAWAQPAADFLVANSKQLGIQCVIYDRRIWSGAHPSSGWRKYSGVDAHTTHLHVEFCWAASKGAHQLTQAVAAAILRRLPGTTPKEWDEMASKTEVQAAAVDALKQDGLVASPMLPGNPSVAPVTAMAFSMQWAYNASVNSGAALGIVREMAAKGTALSADEITAAAKAGAAQAVADVIDSATVNLNVTKES